MTQPLPWMSPLTEPPVALYDARRGKLGCYGKTGLGLKRAMRAEYADMVMGSGQAIDSKKMAKRPVKPCRSSQSSASVGVPQRYQRQPVSSAMPS